MVGLFSWAIFFATIACSLGNTGVSIGLTNCMRLTWDTTAGTKFIGCKNFCDPSNSAVGRECLVLSPSVSTHGRQGVNYTCLLGECDQQNDCKPADLLIDCWAPKPNQISLTT
uniref:Evasin n=1 Tax=Rhipicephalus appendiculatus TaxID=34631 RepID=A0A131YS00_RHIAP